MPRRILFIDHTLYKSGAAISLGTLIRSLPSDVEPFFLFRKGNEVSDIIAACKAPMYFERWVPQFMTTVYSSQYGIWLFVWHAVKAPLAFRHLIQLRRRWKFDLIHLNETTLVAYALMARILNIPVVVHVRTVVARRPLERLLLKLAAYGSKTRFIAIDEESRKSLPAECQKKTQLIYNPIDLGPMPDSLIVQRIREAWGCSTDDVVIGQVASLHRAKGAWQILELAQRICPKRQNVRFVFVGDDQREDGDGRALHKAVEQAGLSKRVIFAGYRSDLASVYKTLDVVLCLFGKGLDAVGRTAYEAALAGRPLVATHPHPDRSPTLINGQTAMVCHPDDLDGLCSALESLISSAARRKELGERAREAIGDRHEPTIVANEVFQLYASLINDAENRNKEAVPVALGAKN